MKRTRINACNAMSLLRTSVPISLTVSHAFSICRNDFATSCLASSIFFSDSVNCFGITETNVIESSTGFDFLEEVGDAMSGAFLFPGDALSPVL